MSNELDFLKDLTNEQIQEEIDNNKKILEEDPENELSLNIVDVWQKELDSRK